MSVKALAFSVGLAAMAALFGCGGQGSSGKSSGASTTASAHEAQRPSPSTPPRVPVPSGPPPHRLVVKDLIVGTGAEIRPHTEIKTLYTAVTYRTREPYEVRWKPSKPFTIDFAPGFEIKGWEKGLVGMRVGGRRELIIPSRMAYHNGTLVYVIDLLSVK